MVRVTMLSAGLTGPKLLCQVNGWPVPALAVAVVDAWPVAPWLSVTIRVTV
jgi:hypothetical protein